MSPIIGAGRGRAAVVCCFLGAIRAVYKIIKMYTYIYIVFVGTATYTYPLSATL